VVTKLQVAGADVPVPADPDDGFDLPIPTKAGTETEIHIEWTDTWSFGSATTAGILRAPALSIGLAGADNAVCERRRAIDR